jgi:hypothetical protein
MLPPLVKKNPPAGGFNFQWLRKFLRFVAAQAPISTSQKNYKD